MCQKRSALYWLSFLAKLNGKEWKDNTGWVADTSVCNWYGIECSDDKKHVVNLDLRENNLIGKIPVGLSVLSGLQTLNLSGNELSGKVPNDLEKLENLQVLDLSNNKLSGDVEMFSTLTGWKKLNISMNEFEGEFASEFADMTNLDTSFALSIENM